MEERIIIYNCLSCKFFHELEIGKNVFKGYCENSDGKDVPKGTRKITIRPTTENTKSGTYPIINSKNIPKWCKFAVQNYK